MENNDKKITDNNNEEEGINVTPVHVQMCDFKGQEFLDKVMTSNVVVGAGAFVSFLLAAAFGIMFIIGGVGLVKGKSSGETAVKSDVHEEAGVETSGHEAEEH